MRAQGGALALYLTYKVWLMLVKYGGAAHRCVPAQALFRAQVLSVLRVRGSVR